MEILFVGWNPPGTRHFWDGAGDDLHDNLRWAFDELGWSTRPDFLADFLGRGCYLVHAVKCWRDPSWPTVDATKRCSPLLKDDIARLQPRTVCLLGRRPHLAAYQFMPSLPPPTGAFRYGHGWCGTVEGRKVIITAFVNRRWNAANRKENRACVVDALRRWV